MKGRLIVLDGVDASGKNTQTEILFGRLKGEGKSVTKVDFPNYNDASSALVKMYLSGEFGENPNDVNPYAASSFYAVDRYASYKKSWGELLEKGEIILSNRYTTSNAIHQAPKIEDERQNEFFDWLYDYEFNLLGLPKPDIVVFLDMPPKAAVRLLSERYNNDESKKDIHEKDFSHLVKAHRSAVKACEYYKWEHIFCAEGDYIKTRQEISDEIYNLLKGKGLF